VTPFSHRLALSVVTIVLILAPSSRADEIVLGEADSISADQPLVTVQMEYPVNSGVAFATPIDKMFLDTGASGILFAKGAYDAIAPLTFHTETRSDGSPVLYEETGVAGTELLEVFQQHDFYFAGSDGTAYELPAVRPFGSAIVDLGDINGIVGMPAMVNRVTHMDLRPQLDETRDTWPFIETSFQSAPSPATSPRFHVALQMVAPGFPGVDPDHPDDPKPTFAQNPFITGIRHTFVDHNNQSHTEEATALLDTGSQLTIISHPLATRLNFNLDRNDPNCDIVDLDQDGTITIDDYEPIGGLGGEISIPLVHLNKLSIPTTEGTYISLTTVEVGVFVDFDGNPIDVAGIDAVLGMNILDSGYLATIFGEGTGGFINEVSFDFRDLDNSQMLLDLNPNFIPEPGALAMLIFTATLLRRPRRATVAA
jgi:hypothetical protein